MERLLRIGTNGESNIQCPALVSTLPPDVVALCGRYMFETFYTFKDKSNETLVKNPGDIEGQALTPTLSQLVQRTVTPPPPAALQPREA